jgi:GAF domain-containing protein
VEENPGWLSEGVQAYRRPPVELGDGGRTVIRVVPRGLAPTLQQLTDAAKQLFRADAAGLMLIDQEGQLRWASASDQTAQTLEDEQERLAQGPCAVAFSQRLSAAIRNIHTEPGWEEFAKVLASESVFAALSVPVELDGGVIGTLDV